MSKRAKALRKWSAILGCAAVIGMCLKAAVAVAPPEAGRETPAAAPKASSTDEGTAAKAKAAGEGEQEQPRLTLLRIIRMGGPLMYVLFGLSIALVAMVTYFFLALSPGNIMPPGFLRRIHQTIRDKKIDEAKMLCVQNRNVVSQIIRSGLEAADKGREGILEAMNSEGSRRASSLWVRISFLSDIAVVAPMVGLLGTVIGMFVAFMNVSGTVVKGGALTVAKGAGGMSVGLINPAYLTSGVAMAVITTIAGLLVAIPAVIAYSYFRAVVQRTIVNLETVCSRYSDAIAGAAK